MRYSTLDGMRGVAALAVVVAHVCEMLFELRLENISFAVDFFFALSGFVLADPKPGFLKQRAIRLLPLSLLGLVAGLLLDPSPPYNYVVPWNGPLWSLVVEAAANLVWGLAAPYLRTRHLVLITATFGAVLLVEALFNPLALDGGWRWDNLIDALPRIGFAFTAGILLRRHPLPVPPVAALLLLLVFVPARLPGFIVLFIPLLVAAGARVTIAPRICNQLGRLSYPVYVLHSPLLFGMLTHRWPLPVALALTALAAHLASVYYDEPIRALLTRRRVALQQA
jgi:peptidoglycan/LPS O-acetylase OafA/YrhL